MRLVILGGGGFRVPLVHRALVDRPNLGVEEVVLYDPEPARLAVVTAVLQPSRLKITTSGSLANALHGADFVFSAIRVGGADGRVRDERRALDAGVLGQETVGAGGLTYALRTLPVALRIAHLIAEVAPSAWLVNFTNPAGLITEALHAVLGPRVVGICDSPAGLIRRVCRVLGVQESDVRPDYVGINHLGWLRGLWSDKHDLLPGLLNDRGLLAGFEEGRLFGPELLQALGCIPNEYGYFYYANRDLVESLRRRPTRGEALLAEQNTFYQAATSQPQHAAELWRQALASREESYLAEARPDSRDAQDMVSGGYSDVALDLISALTGHGRRRLILNVPNGKALPQLPADVVVEIPCTVDKNTITPIATSTLDLHQLGLLAGVRASERAVIEAVTEGSREAARRALLINPLIGSRIAADRLLADLLDDEPSLADLLH